ncbi:YkyB family protein [Neobacillus soli]|uniref:YkyB family protein n=1 Tax=Neobacillus soli TaxID=220688 RepID=UPI0008242BE3|nr:YkyB family protein [Neobacillus soli]
MLSQNQKYPLTNVNLTIDNLAQAIFIVNRHAKTATNPKLLYKLKQESLKKLIEEGKAKKVGLHFSENPRNSRQQSDVLVECGRYTFHIPPTKADFLELPHLGKLDGLVRNPKAVLSLNSAKGLLQLYTGISDGEQPPLNPRKNQRAYQKPVFKKLGERYS